MDCMDGIYQEEITIGFRISNGSFPANILVTGLFSSLPEALENDLGKAG